MGACLNPLCNPAIVSSSTEQIQAGTHHQCQVQQFRKNLLFLDCYYYCIPVNSTHYALSLSHQLVLRRKKYERGNCCYSACADLPACLYYKCPGVCIYDGHWHPSIDPMRQHHQDGGHKIDAFEEV